MTDDQEQELRQWVYEELEPWFQGEYGTMDSMLEMFIDELMEKIESSQSQGRS